MIKLCNIKKSSCTVKKISLQKIHTYLSHNLSLMKFSHQNLHKSQHIKHPESQIFTPLKFFLLSPPCHLGSDFSGTDPTAGYFGLYFLLYSVAVPIKIILLPL